MSIVFLLNFNACLHCSIWQWKLYLFKRIFFSISVCARGCIHDSEFLKQHHKSLLLQTIMSKTTITPGLDFWGLVLAAESLDQMTCRSFAINISMILYFLEASTQKSWKSPRYQKGKSCNIDYSLWWKWTNGQCTLQTDWMCYEISSGH